MQRAPVLAHTRPHQPGSLSPHLKPLLGSFRAVGSNPTPADSCGSFRRPRRSSRRVAEEGEELVARENPNVPVLDRGGGGSVPTHKTAVTKPCLNFSFAHRRSTRLVRVRSRSTGRSSSRSRIYERSSCRLDLSGKLTRGGRLDRFAERKKNRGPATRGSNARSNRCCGEPGCCS